MTPSRFNPDEREVIRNLDLLMRARRTLKEEVLNSVVARWEHAIWNHAREHGLRRVDQTIPYTEDGRDVEDSHAADSTAGFDPSETSGPRYMEYAGREASACYVPRLSISSDGFLDLFGGSRGLSVAIDYKTISESFRSRPDAKMFVDANELKPQAVLGQEWYEKQGDKEGQRLRFDSRWDYELKPRDLEINLTSLMHGHRREPLRTVCPFMAGVLDRYTDLCQRFARLSPDKMGRLPKKVAKQRSFANSPPEISRLKGTDDEEGKFVRENVAGFLRSEWVYSVADPTTGERPLRERLSESVSELIMKRVKKIAGDALIERVEADKSDPSDPEPQERWSSAVRLEWIVPGNRKLRLTFVVKEELTAIKTLVAKLDLRGLIRPGNLAAAQATWSDSRAFHAFKSTDGVEWVHKRSLKEHTFWGYWTPRGALQIDMVGLAGGSAEALAPVDRAVSDVQEALRLLRSHRRQLSRK